MHNLTPAALLLAAAAALATPALAQDGSLTLLIGGEAYDGDPRFAVSFGGTALGEGVIDTAIDTATTGRFADAADKSDYVGEFRFAIPRAAFKPDAEVRISFLNEAFGGPGSDRDRNLYIKSISVNGIETPAAELTTVSRSGMQPNAMLGEYLVIYDGTTPGVLAAPDAGWPRPGERVQAQTPVIGPPPAPSAAAEPAATDTAELPTDNSAAPDAAVPATSVAEIGRDAAAPADAGLLAQPRPVVPAPRLVRADADTLPDLTPTAGGGDAPAEIELASVDTSALENGACRKAERYNVLGFAENSNEVTPRVIERLNQILGDIGGQRCVIHVTGYSDTRGSYATNALFAVERAQNVLIYLRRNGLQYLDVNATGAGETNQFGTARSANRRVVITVRP